VKSISSIFCERSYFGREGGGIRLPEGEPIKGGKKEGRRTGFSIGPKRGVLYALGRGGDASY